MKHTVLILLATALVMSLQTTPSQAANPETFAKTGATVPAFNVSQCTKTKPCNTDCRKPICPRCHGSSCMVICEMKKVKKTVWVVECEKFAPVNPGCGLLDILKGKLASHTKNDCGEPGTCCDDGCCGKSCCSKCVPPQCGKVRCKKKLIKKEITCKVPVYKCVVTGCRATCTDGDVDDTPAEASTSQPQAAPAPTAPKATSKPVILEPPVARLRVPTFNRY